VYSVLTSAIVFIARSFNIPFVNQVITANKRVAIKFILFTTLLFLRGLPPFIGFLPK
jgi:hypothetical protein